MPNYLPNTSEETLILELSSAGFVVLIQCEEKGDLRDFTISAVPGTGIGKGVVTAFCGKNYKVEKVLEETLNSLKI